MEQRHTLYLFGNGLSLAFNADHYALPAVTAAVQERLSSLTGNLNASLLDDLQNIAIAIDAQAQDVRTTDDFEDIAGPIDRLTHVLELPELIAIARLSGDTSEQAMATLRDRVQRTYHQVVGAVLEIVMSHEGEKEGWDRVNEVATHVVDDARTNGYADVYLLNYDTIFDSASLETRELTHFNLTDEFSGRGIDTGPISLFAGAKQLITAHAWREEPWAPSDAVYLNHLHGAGSWLQTSGGVYKAKLELTRFSGQFSGQLN